MTTGVGDRMKSRDETLDNVSMAQDELQEALSQYISDTLSHIDVVKEFSKRLSKWMLERKREMDMMKDIKERSDRIDLNFDHISKSEDKAKALGEYMKSFFTQMTADSRREELEKELAGVLKDTLGGLEKLSCFLDAVEKLAVTSLHVFMDKNHMLELPQGVSLESVQAVIAAGKLACPLLIQFKRDAGAFFIPSLHNVEVLAFQLDKYIDITQMICERMEKSSVCDHWENMSIKTMVFDVDLTEDDTQKMLHHINQLINVRMDQHFRLVFLFQEDFGSGFIKNFIQRQPRMLQSLAELEESAVQLDRMKMGAKISSVAGSSVGAVGGVLSIIGLALIPVTLGASLALTMTGVSLGITSGVNSAVTVATEIGVNRTHQNKANEVLQSFMEDVQSFQDCLEEASHQNLTILGKNNVDVALGVGKMITNAGTIGKGIDSIVDCASAVKLLNSEELILSAGKVGLQEGKAVRNLPRVASEIPDIGQAVAKGPLALSQSARAGLMTVNALFLGLDLFIICKDSISLSKGSESEVSQFIRARAALWRSELDSWQKIHDSLHQGMRASEKSQSILEMPFYPVRKIQFQNENGLQSKPEKKWRENKWFCNTQ